MFKEALFHDLYHVCFGVGAFDQREEHFWTGEAGIRLTENAQRVPDGECGRLVLTDSYLMTPLLATQGNILTLGHLIQVH